jgi:glutaredoxin-like protein
MAIFDENTKNQLKELLKSMDNEVELLVVFENQEKENSKLIDSILTELSEISEKIKYIKETSKNEKLIEKEKIQMFPCINIKGQNKGKIKYYGVPGGHEFSSFIETILMASKNTNHISKENQEKVSNIKKELNIDVFVTPTCPNCPASVILANSFAMLSDKVNASTIEAQEFIELSKKNNISGVPHTIVNNKEIEWVGAYPEDGVFNKLNDFF